MFELGLSILVAIGVFAALKSAYHYGRSSAFKEVASQRAMSAFLNTLTPEQRIKALKYRGKENHG